jgi:Domain of unknown function (DUF4111)
MKAPRVIDPVAVMTEMIAVLSTALSARLVSVVALGSCVHGDFEPARSDVNLLAVLTDDPTPQDITAIGALLDAVFADTTNGSTASRLAWSAVRRLRMSWKRVDHRVSSAGSALGNRCISFRRNDDASWTGRPPRGRTVYGMPAALPSVPWSVTREVLLDELRSWRAWVQDLDGVNRSGTAFTVSRTIASASTGTPHSKRAGARWLRERKPHFRGLLDNCEAIWHDLGSVRG